LLAVVSVYGQHSNNPVANDNAIVQFGNARFTILTPQLVRLEWSPKKRFEDQASFVVINRNLPVPTFQQNIQKNN
jgi:hypothetical protein